MQILFIVNDSPYSSDKCYNGIRTAIQIQKEDPTIKILIFLMGDGVGCALKDQKSISTTYNIEQLLLELLEKKGMVKVCKSCLDSRGYSSNPLINGAEISNMTEYARWIINSDKVINL